MLDELPKSSPAQPAPHTRRLLAVVAVAVLAAQAAGQIVYVRADAASGGNGQTWATAFNNLPAAFAASPPNAEIWVKTGTYTTTGDGFAVPSGRALYGGFVGTETQREQRDPVARVTTLSGGSLTTVVTLTGTSAETRVDGFTITNGLGRGNTSSLSRPGGGLRLIGGSATFANCFFKNNACTASAYCCGYDQTGPGGAVYVVNAAALFENCRFLNNRACDAIIMGCSGGHITAVLSGQPGGAIYTSGSALTFRDCTFQGNLAGAGFASCCNQGCASLGGQSGGAIYASGGSLTIDRCSFVANRAMHGTAAVCFLGGAPSTEGGHGGAIMLAGCPLLVTNSIFFGNSAGSGGGASDPPCAYPGSTGGRGGAIHSTSSSTATIINCTFKSNAAGASGAGAPFAPGGAVSGPCYIRNSIFWGNTDSTGNLQSAQIGNNTDVAYSTVQGIAPGLGAGNLSDDPLFMDPDGPNDIAGDADDDVRLWRSSRCIDAGSNAEYPPQLGGLDRAGAPRLLDDPATTDVGIGTAPVIDMGAFEFRYDGCQADLDDDGDFANGLRPDGGVEINDLLVFLAGLDAGDPRVDLDDDGDPAQAHHDRAVDLNDLLFFLQRLAGGC